MTAPSPTDGPGTPARRPPAPRRAVAGRPAPGLLPAGPRGLLAAGLLMLALTALPAGPAAAVDSTLSWASLTASEQQALAPLKRDWASIEGVRRQKWLEVATRFPSMSAEEKARIQQRMAAWAALTPAERASARLQFQEARRLSPEDRQARWEAYRALPEAERERLVQASRPGARRPGGNGAHAADLAAKDAPKDTAAVAATFTAKSNVVPLVPAPRPRAVAPTVVQARPGVSTTTMVAPARPPVHHQTGLPKIVATPGFVDPHTLLPQRGPQGAAVRSATPPESAPSP